MFFFTSIIIIDPCDVGPHCNILKNKYSSILPNTESNKHESTSTYHRLSQYHNTTFQNGKHKINRPKKKERKEKKKKEKYTHMLRYQETRKPGCHKINLLNIYLKFFILCFMIFDHLISRSSKNTDFFLYKLMNGTDV